MKRPLKTKRERFAFAFCILLFAVPMLAWSRPAPFHDVYGDVYRGWPLAYGLDQGDVTLEYLFRLAYFSWPRFLADLGLATIAGTFAYCLAVGVREVLWRKTCEQA